MRNKEKVMQGFQLLEPEYLGANEFEYKINEPSYEPNLDPKPAVNGDEYTDLMADIVKMTLRDLLHNKVSIREKAKAWFFDEDARPPSQAGGITLRWICDCHGVEPDYMLRKLRREAVEIAIRKSKKKKSRLREFLARLSGFASSTDIEWAWSEAERKGFKEDEEVKK